MRVSLPVVVRGDFNLIRFASEKNNSNINQPLMDKVNIFINLHQLQEIRRSGPIFTWTNNQSEPVMVKLDRILMSTNWEAKVPRCFAWRKTRIGSDHCPIILDTGEDAPSGQRFFFFEKQWLLEEDFVSKFDQNRQKVRARFTDSRYSMDVWHGCLSMSRQYLRGWYANRIIENRKHKMELLAKLEQIDSNGCTQEDACMGSEIPSGSKAGAGISQGRGVLAAEGQ
jgi:hypothetical protein